MKHVQLVMTKIFLLNKSEHNKKKIRNAKDSLEKTVSLITTIIKLKSTPRKCNKQKKKKRKSRYL